MTLAKTRIFLVDDHRLVRDGLRMTLQREHDMEVVGEACGAGEAVEHIRQLAPDLVVMDVHLGAADGIVLSKCIIEQNQRTKVLILSGLADVELVNRALNAGVSGYLLKTNAAADLIKAVRNVMAGNSCLSPEISQALVVNYKRLLAGEIQQPKQQLTGREREVLKLTAEGLRIKEIASLLSISSKTVETHRANLLKKLGCSSSAELTRYAIREGISPI